MKEPPPDRRDGSSLGIELVEQVVNTLRRRPGGPRRGPQGEGRCRILPPDSIALSIPRFVLEASARKAVPSKFGVVFWAEQGSLASCGPDESIGPAARTVGGKDTHGAKPPEIPVEVNNRIGFVIHLKTAQTLGLTMPRAVVSGQSGRPLRAAQRSERWEGIEGGAKSLLIVGQARDCKESCRARGA